MQPSRIVLTCMMMLMNVDGFLFELSFSYFSSSYHYYYSLLSFIVIIHHYHSLLIIINIHHYHPQYSLFEILVGHA